jgi:hypothetical protein
MSVRPRSAPLLTGINANSARGSLLKAVVAGRRGIAERSLGLSRETRHAIEAHQIGYWRDATVIVVWQSVRSSRLSVAMRLATSDLHARVHHRQCEAMRRFLLARYLRMSKSVSIIAHAPRTSRGGAPLRQLAKNSRRSYEHGNRPLLRFAYKTIGDYRCARLTRRGSVATAHHFLYNYCLQC